MKPTKVLILFYSFTGKTAELAREIAQGVKEVPDTEVVVKRMPELIPDNFFAKEPGLKAIQDKLFAEFSVATSGDLVAADGVAFGTPVHFGSFSSQVKQYIDQLSPAWVQGKLINKPAAVFCSAASNHGGAEAALTSLTIPLLNLGMIPVGIPYPIRGEDPEFDAGSPYGAVFVSGHKGDKSLSEGDRKTARILGRRLAAMAHMLNCGCDVCRACRELTKKL